MNDRLLVEALRARGPDALAAVYDAYAESLYRYCWFMLRSRDSAQVALRDTLIVAEAKVDGLGDPGMLKPWLYALARAECLRRRAVPPDSPDVELADHGWEDAQLRLISWHAVDGLPTAHREALELTNRHGLDGMALAAVLGRQPKDVQELLTAARASLEDSLTAEILARKGVYECAERSRLLQGWDGRLTKDARGLLAAHATECATCRRHRPRNVATAKVFGLLPEVPLPDDLRIRVKSCFTDPELSSFRTFVAARAGAFGAAGFPRQDGRRTGRWRMPTAIAAAACAVFVVAAVFHTLGGEHDVARSIASGSWPGESDPTWGGGRLGEEPTARTPTSPGRQTTPGHGLLGDGLLNTPTRPSDGSTGVLPVPTRNHQTRPAEPGGPPTSEPVPSPTPGTLAASPGSIDLGTDRDTATIAIVARGGPVDWQANTNSGAVSLSAWSGRLAAGERQTLTVYVDRSMAPSGSATVSFTGAAAVRVSWSAPEPSPSPTSSPTGTAAPTGSATPTRTSTREPTSAPTSTSSPEPEPTSSGPSPEPEPEPEPEPTATTTSSG